MMSVIRYISISDLHLGADNSLLTNVNLAESKPDPTRPSDVLMQLAQCLKRLSAMNGGQQKPRLILNGDVLELALAHDNHAIMAFERFMECLFPDNEEPVIADEILFIPGNHDHHLWETARETQYAEFLKKIDPASPLEAPWHTTKMFDADPVNANLLNTVAHRYERMKNVSLTTVYPNLGFMSSDASAAVMFTHGHFTESIYSVMSELRTFLFPGSRMPLDVWDLEEENFAWIDFFWSTMGRSGAVGDDVERIYMMLLVPEMTDALAHQVGVALAAKWVPHIPFAADVFEKLTYPVLRRIAGLEKSKPNETLSPEASAGLKAYVEGPMLRQLRSDRKIPPLQATLIFGHTHKPFVDAMTFAGIPTAVFNTGGWVVDTPTAAPLHGASLVLIDDAWHVAALRVYNEGNYTVKAEAAEPDGSNPLFVQLQQHLTQDPKPWEELSSKIAVAVEAFHKDFNKRLQTIRPAAASRRALVRAV